MTKSRKLLYSVLAVTALLILAFLFSNRSKEIELVAPAQKPQELQQLFTKLKKDKFVIEQVDGTGTLRFSNCETEENFDFSGTGVQSYYARSPIAIPDNIYPDFHLYVLNFETPDVARNYADQILFATRNQQWSDGECVYNKIPWKVVRNERNVYLLTARAEVLRMYVDRYGDFLQDSKNSE